MKSLQYFKALSDVNRIRILNLLLNYELGVNEIVALMQMGQSGISRHLKILTDAGLLQCRRDGVWAFYSAARSGNTHKFIHSIKYLFEEDERFKWDLIQAEQIIDARKTDTINFFNSIALEWDRLKLDVLGTFNLNAEIINHIEPCRIAADLGCGTGECLFELTKTAEQVIGVDSSIKMLELARQRFQEGDYAVDLRLGALEHLPLKDEEVDCAVTSMVLHHLSNPLEAIAEVGRVLRSGGTYIIIDFQKHDNEKMRQAYGDRWLGFTSDEMTRWLKQYRFYVSRERAFTLRQSLNLQLYKAIKDD